MVQGQKQKREGHAPLYCTEIHTLLENNSNQTEPYRINSVYFIVYLLRWDIAIIY